VVATRRNGSDGTQARQAGRTCLPSAPKQLVGPPADSLRAEHLVDLIIEELERHGIAATRVVAPPGLWSGPGDPAGTDGRPKAVGIRVGDDAIVLVVDRATVRFLFGELRGGRVGLRTFLRATRARCWENRLCDSTIETALADSTRRLLIVCDTGRAAPAERDHAIRWVREVAHRIGYECSMNGLDDLATSYLVLFADTDAGEAARSVVEWRRTGEVRPVRS